jgi:cation:H+ antiporter
MNWTFNITGILAGLIMMTGGSFLLVRCSSNVAAGLGVRDLVIGTTIVALGTSLPELITVLMASAQGKHEIGIGNLAGSNILNVLVILGLAAIILPVQITHNQPIGPDLAAAVSPLRQREVVVTVIFLVGATFYLLYGLLLRREITRLDGLLLFAMGILFWYLSFQRQRV